MKKVVEINTCDYGSTGKIMLQISEIARDNGYKCKIVVPEGRHNTCKNKKDYIRLGNRFSEDSHIVLGYCTGFEGCFSIFSTYRLIKKLKEYKPDIIHLHNLHKCYINLPILFKYIKNNNIRVIWTLHDCWAFTGHCPYFTLAKCDKWKTGCYNCPQYREYPQSLIDNSKIMWKLKRKWFTSVNKMTIVTPSQWLADLVKESYLRNYPVKVINNGIDISIFQPTESRFREQHGIMLEQKMLLGVAFGWGKRKGLDVFLELYKRLDPLKYKIVLVGTDSNIDKLLPKGIISIHRTQNQKELVEIYSAADLFVNPTREDNYPTVNMEAIACGTPVITFDTGGSAEILDETCGIAIPTDNIDIMEQEIRHICNDRSFSAEECSFRAKTFNMLKHYQKYMEEYISILK